MRLIVFCIAVLFVPLSAMSNDITARLSDEAIEIALPKGLIEISGLAAGSGNSVYAHNDEHAIVFEVDTATGEIERAFALGRPTVKADFEGIAVLDDRIYLISSAGMLFEAPIGDHRARVKYNVFDTGVGDFCEVEGLSNGPDAGEFLILCKAARTDALHERLAIFSWSIDQRTPVVQPKYEIHFDRFLTPTEQEFFRPSAIDWDQNSGTALILSARNNLLIRINAAEQVTEKVDLSPERHVQAEGVALMPNGAIVIADEGAARAPGKITVYPPSP